MPIGIWNFGHRYLRLANSLVFRGKQVENALQTDGECGINVGLIRFIMSSDQQVAVENYSILIRDPPEVTCCCFLASVRLSVA